MIARKEENSFAWGTRGIVDVKLNRTFDRIDIST